MVFSLLSTTLRVLVLGAALRFVLAFVLDLACVGRMVSGSDSLELTSGGGRSRSSEPSWTGGRSVTSCVMLDEGRTLRGIAALSGGTLTTEVRQGGVIGEGVTTGIGGGEAFGCRSAGSERLIGLQTGAEPRLRLAKPGPVFHCCLRPPRPRWKPRPLPPDFALPLPLGAPFC